MNQIISKPRYLFLLLGVLISSAGMAQSPLQKTKTANAQTAIQSPAALQKKDQDSKKTPDQGNQDDDTNVLLAQKSINGQALSQEESDAVTKQAKASEALFTKKESSTTAKRAQSSDTTKVRSFAKSSKLTIRNVFEVKKAEFELSTTDKMQLKSVSDKHGRSLATYQQLHNSVPVVGAIYKVRENKNKIDAFGEVIKKLPTSNKYKVNASQGLENALKTVNAKEYLWQSKKLSSLVHKDIKAKPEGELVYVGPNYSAELKEYHLAWKYDIFATNPQSSQTIYVDAESGKIILKIDLNRDAHVAGPANNIGKGKARYAGNVEFNTKQYADGYRLEALQGKYAVPIYTLNMNHYDHPSDEILTEYIDEDNNWNDLYDKDGNEVAIDIHWGLQKTIDYFEEKFDRNSVDDKGMTIFGLAHLGNNVDNASWTGGWAQFGDGNNLPFASLAITGHELTHAVTQFSADLIYQGESGAMNESFSDIFGVSIEFYVAKDSKNDIWLLGDELYSHGSLRSMSDPKAQGQPDTYGGTNWVLPTNTFDDNGGVHTNSGVTNYWYYLLVEGGSGVNDLNNSYDIKPIGLAKAEKIAYLTLTEYLSPSSNFSDMRTATLLAAEDLFGLGSEEYIQITNAWYAVGVGNSYSDKQLAIVSVEKPSSVCVPLNGEEPFLVTLKNTGTTVLKADEIVSFKLRAMAGVVGRLKTFYTVDGEVPFTEDLAPGEETTIKVQGKIPYQTGTTINYIEVKLDLKPVVEFGAKDGYSFVSTIVVPIAPKDFDIKVTELQFPMYTGDALTASYTPTITFTNLGCQDIPVGTVIKVGYANTIQGSVAVWKDVTLEKVFKSKSQMTVTFDTSIDLSAPGLHTYEGYVTLDQDPITTNNSILNAAYNGIVTQLPYTMDFERTPGGWNTKALSGTHKFMFQAYPASFRTIKSQYLWAATDIAENQKLPINSDFVLESPIFDFTNVVSPYIEFDLIYSFHKGYDGLIVEYSEDKGKTWKKAEDVNYPETTHYDDTEGGWFTGVNTQTKKDPYRIRLNEFAGKKVAIRFHIKTDDYFDGFIGGFLDNILVSDAPYDIEVLSAKLDAGKCTINNTNVTVSGLITNNFATESQVVNITTKVLDASKTEVFSKTEKTTLNFAKFKDTVSYSVPNINLKDVGEHTVTFSVFPEDMTQDVKQGNNAVTFAYDNWNNEDMKIAVLPYKMDFEDASKYKGWSTFENKGAAGWKQGLRADLGSPGWFIADHTKFMASNDDKCNCDASNDMLVSPVFDLTNYKEAHLSFDGYGDAQRWSDGYVKVSTDGGETWQEIFHMPYYGAWWEYSVDLTPYAGKSCVQVAFVHNDNGLFANGFAVDNIEIKEKKDYLRLTNFSVPETVYEDAPSSEFFVSARNLSYNAINKVKVEFQITQNGTEVGNPVALDKNDEILIGQTIVYKINGLPSLAAGNYEITVKATAEGDSSAQSITGIFQVVEKAPDLSTENFSNITQGSIFGSKGFVSNQSDENYPWRAVPVTDNTYIKIPTKDHTGNTDGKLLYSQLEGNYYYSELVSPMYKLAASNTALEFNYAMESNVSDVLIVDVKPVGGEWSEVWRNATQGIHADTEWKKGTANISNYAGKSIMVRFRHNKSDGYSYLVLDDLNVISEAISDVSLQILSPKDICGNDEVKVRLTNEGQKTITENSVQLDLDYYNTGETISEIVTSEIPVRGSIEYVFKKQPKLDDSGDSHVFTINAKLENDILEQNNIVKNYIYQGVSSNFKIFDSPVIHTYADKTLYIDAETNFLEREQEVVSYKWNTGASTNDIVVSEAGDYTVTAVLKNGCTVSETVKVVFDTFASELQSGNVCGSVVLNPGNYKAYEWFDGSTAPTYLATESGDYYVTVYNESGLGKILKTSISVTVNDVTAPTGEATQTFTEGQTLANIAITATGTVTWYASALDAQNGTNPLDGSTLLVNDVTYYATQTVGTCTSVTSLAVKATVALGVNEFDSNSFRMYPNPVHDILNLSYSKVITSVKVFNILGQEVKHTNINAVNAEINLSELPKGTYLVKVTSNDQINTVKIIKE